MPEFTRTPASLARHRAAASYAQYQPGLAVGSPRQFPAVPQRLVGREPELTALDRMRSGWRKTPAVAVISGPAGIGKTALALRWLRQSDPFPDGQLYASFGDTAVESVQDVLGRWLQVLCAAAEWIPPGRPQRSALWQEVSAERRLAVLVDDAPSAAAIGALHPGPGSAVLAATARCELPGAAADGARLIRLQPLGLKAAATPLEQVAGMKRLAAERDAAEELAKQCGGVPLALRCAAGALAISPKLPVAGVASLLTAELSHASTGPAGAPAVVAALHVPYAVLGPDAARTYRLLSLHPGPEFGSGLAAAVLGMSPRGALTVIGGLRRARLLDQAGHDRYRFHDLVRGHARARADAAKSGQARHAAEERIIGWHLRHAARAALLLPPCTPRPVDPCSDGEFSTAGQALDWLDRERPSLRAVVALAARMDNPAAVWQLADALWPLWRYRDHYGEQLKVARAGLAAARACADRNAKARMHGDIGIASHYLGQPGEAARSFARARVLWHELGDDRRRSMSMSWLGQVAAARGDHETAIILHQRALAICREDVRQASLVRIELGRVLTAVGRLDEAATLLCKAVRVLDDGRDPLSLARARAALGRTLLSRPSEAAALLESALETMRNIRLPEQAEILQALAETAARIGDPRRARAYSAQAAVLQPTRRQP